MYKDLRFFGHYIHEAGGWEHAQETVNQEMKARKPDAAAPGGYAADEDFKKETSRFGQEYREMARDLIKRARDGHSITRDEYITLVRGEKLYAQAQAAGPGVASHRLKLLEAGRHAFEGHGMSDSRMLGKLTGFDKDGVKERVSVAIDHGFKR